MALARYRELVDKVDAFFARVLARHADRLQCRAGCDDCCRQQLSVTTVEADAIFAALPALSDEVRERLRARAAHLDPRRCVALEEDGRCAIYAARPLVCRSHGVPIRTSPPRSLPVIDACEKNFIEGGPAAADPDCVLDQTTLSTMLLAIDAEHARTNGTKPGERVALSDVLRSSPHVPSAGTPAGL